MSLRQQAKILEVNAGHLSRMVNGKRPWRPELKVRYEALVGNTQQKLDNGSSHLVTAHSSSGLGHRPLKAEITGSNPVCATIPLCFNVPLVGSCTNAQRTTF